MRCRRAKALIFDFIDGMINDRDRAALEEHLGVCQACEKQASGLSRSLDLLHRITPEQPDENFAWKVRLRLAKERNATSDAAASERRWVRSWNFRFAMSAASALVVVIATGYFVSLSEFRPGGGLPLAHKETIHKPLDTTTPVVVHRGSARGPVLVSGGDVRNRGESGLLKEDSVPRLDRNALTQRYLKSKAAAYRIRKLEQQVDVLQTQLRKCEVGDK